MLSSPLPSSLVASLPPAGLGVIEGFFGQSWSWLARNHYAQWLPAHGYGFYIYAPKAELSTAENILMMLREDRKYTKLEAEILDMALVLHMDHGGGNNSTFTTHVVTSSGTDTYSTIAAAMASLKGPKHGGANIKVTQMFEDMKSVLTDFDGAEQTTLVTGERVCIKRSSHTAKLIKLSKESFMKTMRKKMKGN